MKSKSDLDSGEEMRGVSVLGFGFRGGGSPEKKVVLPSLAVNLHLLQRRSIGEIGRGIAELGTF